MSIPKQAHEIKTKSQALNYCLSVCRGKPGCAHDCKIRKKWKIPPHGEKYYE